VNKQQLTWLRKIKDYIVEKLQSVDAGHDLSHILRVLNNARLINSSENADEFFVEAGVLLHDITDEKLFNKVESEKELKCFLLSLGIDDDDIVKLFEIINSVSFGNELDGKKELSIEQKIVRDADRLDAIGAIGIARTFHYGGSKNREIFNSNIPPAEYNSSTEYRKSTSPTINHFYEKLLLLKDRMETTMGKKMALERHQFMHDFLKQFYMEIGEEGF
jgi:uncharacterized protein